jgi:hypothetical protein
MCDGKRYINFVWAGSSAARYPELSKYPKHIVRKQDLKMGSLWECQICHHKWYLDYSGSTMHQVPKDREEILDRWSAKPLKLSPELLKVLAQIGATPPDIFGNHTNEIVVPCRVQTKEGVVFDPAIVSFQRLPPIEYWQKNIHLIDEIETIQASESALPAEVRVATSEADEVRMGFAPTIVLAPHGTRFCLNWTTNLFIHPTIKAGSIRVAASVRYDSSIQHVSALEADVARFIGDWQDELVSLRLKTKTPRRPSPFKLISTGPIS